MFAIHHHILYPSTSNSQYVAVALIFYGASLSSVYNHHALAIRPAYLTRTGPGGAYDSLKSLASELLVRWVDHLRLRVVYLYDLDPPSARHHVHLLPSAVY
eukprot:scaffold55383_cov16-Prasinocladus_malaysianus.AAC.2